MAGTYSNRADILEDFTELRKRIKLSGPRRSRSSLPWTSGGPKKQLGPDEVAEIIAKYEAAASMVQLKVEHHMAKRTVAKGAARGESTDPAARRPAAQLNLRRSN
ncbi:hypothetical protein [Nocardia sp. NPDC050412]|uniref:hypothetical protein n=1 Tax=Nocardia sp. NPDC050412 TaxID=3364320 RepID=UPI0037914B9B